MSNNGHPTTSARYDGITNAATGAGATQFDRTIHTRPNLSTTALTEQEVGREYRVNPYARRISTLPATHCVRRGWSVSLGTGEKTEALAADIADIETRIALRQRMREADTWGLGVVGGAGVVLRANDGPQDEPIDLAKVADIIGANTFWGTRLYPDRMDYETDPLEPRWGEPKSYLLSANAAGYGTVATETRIDASRILSFPGHLLPPDEQGDTPSGGLWPNDSAINMNWDALRALATIEQGTEHNVSALRLLALHGPWSQMVEGTDESALLARLSQIQFGLSDYQALVLDNTSGIEESAEFHALDLRGIVDIIRHFALKLSAATSIPLTLLVGQAPAGLSTDDASGTRNWNEYIQARQVDVYEQPIIQAWRVMAASLGATDVEPVVTFSPLDDPDLKTIADTQLVEAQTSAVYWERDGLEDPRGIVDTRGPITTREVSPDAGTT